MKVSLCTALLWSYLSLATKFARLDWSALVLTWWTNWITPGAGSGNSIVYQQQLASSLRTVLSVYEGICNLKQVRNTKTDATSCQSLLCSIYECECELMLLMKQVWIRKLMQHDVKTEESCAQHMNVNVSWCCWVLGLLAWWDGRSSCNWRL